MIKNKRAFCLTAIFFVISMLSSMVLTVAAQIDDQTSGIGSWQPSKNFVDPVTLKIQEFREQGLSDDQITVELEKLDMGWYPKTGATWIGKALTSEEQAKMPISIPAPSNENEVINRGNAWDVSNLVGKNNDDYAHIYGGNYGDAGYIMANMNHISTGEVVAYGYGNSGYYYSDLYCYVNYGGGTWYALPNNPVQVNYWDGIHYIDFGNAPIAFDHIAIVGYNDNGYSVSLNLDAVHAVY